MARDLDGLLANPMFMAGLGLLGSNQWSGAATGLLAAQQGRQALAQSQREQQLYDLKMQEYQAKQRAAAEKKAALQQLIQQRPDLGPLVAAGIDVSSMLKPQEPQQSPALVQEYDFAKKNGFGGTFMDYISSKRAPAMNTTPSAVQEWEYYNALPDDKKEAYLRLQRGDMQINTGGAVVIPGRVYPNNPAVVYEKTLAPGDRPETKGAQAAAKVAGESQAKRQATMSGINDILGEAEKILVNGGPTASGAGAAIDAVAGFAGVAPAGAAEADQLEAIGGALISKMPRMEGPQSNYDVENYKVMAGRIGDRALPVSRRLAALRTVRQLWAKYEHLNRDAPAGDSRPGAVSVDDLLNKYGGQ